jgi:hypothetical protein
VLSILARFKRRRRAPGAPGGTELSLAEQVEAILYNNGFMMFRVQPGPVAVVSLSRAYYGSPDRRQLALAQMITRLRDFGLAAVEHDGCLHVRREA